MVLADIPTPPGAELHLGQIPIRAYALCIMLGIVVAVWLTERRLRARGVRPGFATDVATWAVPFGLVGARLYHLITDPELYWGKPGLPGTLGALEVWHGGLGIWGGVAAGALGAYIATRRAGVRFSLLADAAAPGIVLAQGIGRWGNYFNQELYGARTSLPWGVRIDGAHNPTGVAHLYQPTFLYESIWDIGVAVFVIWAARRFHLTGGRVFALYVMAYTAGRAWVEALRTDHANHFLGLRINDWVSMAVFLAALAFFLLRRNAADPEPPEPAAVDLPEPAAVDLPETSPSTHSLEG